MRSRIVVAVAVAALLTGSVAFAQPGIWGWNPRGGGHSGSFGWDDRRPDVGRLHPHGPSGPTYTQVVVIGDSLSDNGNVFLPAPYWNGRASNGPVAVEYLGEALGVSLADLAWYGATTGVGNYADGGSADAVGLYGLPGMTTVFNMGLSQGPIDPDALYIVWGGPNDFWAVADPQGAAVAISKAATNVVAIVQRLQVLGAKHILVPNMVDLGTTPLVRAYGPFFSWISASYNQELKFRLPAGVHYFDTFSLVSGAIANPGAYGLTNVTDPCLGDSICADPSSYLFWDVVHPTTTVHAIVADAMQDGLERTVIIGRCDSGVPDVLAGGGFTISELIAQADHGTKRHDRFERAVASITNGLVESGVISGRQKGAIQSCAAR